MRTRRLFISAAAPLLLLFVLASCAHVSVDPIEVKPITMTLNVNVKVDRQLDEFFAFENKYQGPATTQSASTQPTAATTAPAADPALATPAASPAAQPADLSTPTP
jgi:hypothetical protein